MKDHSIDVNKIFVIDATGNTPGINHDSISHPSSLTELSIKLVKLTDSGKYEYLFLDSLSILLMYNELKTGEKFVRYLANRIKLLNMKTVILSLDDTESKEIIKIASSVSDKIIRIE